ncbi:NAD(P)H-flavin reductase [Enhydrobacter aerosaccus]|uniref:NAD(P)H-flavin reductase n=1 Tax=Enhydrobacter aerosaccus TaxID=225324 RepID=A0A1T4T353_9HYPH|nr:FAD/NAD(P)-binding protein [Enhydrobacter aerosaccus]SKA34944.1 NAD(P)H-flavin reductase [Enhydrobacter aerosaccus]
MSTAILPDTLRAGPDPMLPRLATVRRRRRDTSQVWTLDIEDSVVSNEPFVPGQFNMLGVFGVGEVPISLSGDPAVQDQLVHTIRAVGPVSKALVRLKPGEVLGLRGPFGTGWPVSDAVGRDVIVIAGGLGLAPLRPALYRLLAQRERYRSIQLLYGTRSPDDILFRRELLAWRRRHDIAVEITVDHAPADWTGHVGVVTTLVSRSSFDPAQAIAFVCGPEIMMRFAIAALGQAGLADEAIYLSMERNMQCAVGVCGHCQFGPSLVCRDGPVYRHDRVRSFLGVKEL